MTEPESFFVKVNSPDFKLPQVVLDNLPEFATKAEVDAAVVAYVASTMPIQREELSYTHYQSTPAAIWDFIHPLSFSPNVTITDSAGTELKTEIIHIPPNRIRSISSGAFSGTARLS